MRARWAVSTILILVLLFTISVFSHQVSIAQTQLPDLTIAKAWYSSGQICYSLKNIGNGNAGSVGAPVSYYNILYIDGKQVAEDHMTIIMTPGQQVDRCFNYTFQMTPPQHTITICADWKQNIKESNEQNNCWEQVWTMEEKLPDLLVDKIECGAGNKLSVTVKNNGTGALPTGWTALGEIYFNGQSKGTFSLTNPTYNLNGGIAVAGGSSTYLLSWDILAPTLVRCIADITNNIKESNEQNNYKESNIAPPFASCPSDCACLTLDEAKAQGYSLYCGGTQTLCGYDSNNVPKYCWTKVSPPPDLLVQGVRLNSLGAGEYEIEYTLVNWGRGVSTASVSGLYIDGTLVAEDTVASLLSAEERVEVFAWHFNTASCTPPSDTIRVVADYRDLIDESYEDNNEGSITWACAEFRPPDLHIRRVWTEPISTSEHRIGYEVENIGTGPAPTSRTGLYVDDVLVAEDAVVALAPLERREKVFSYTYNLTSCSGDSDTIRVVVDFALAVSETNEGNNEESLVWECPEGAKPDLVIHTVWWEHEPNSLQNITLNYSIENRSIAPAGPSVTRLWINDVQVATSNVPALDGGEVLAMVTFPERWTPQLNNNHVLIRADIYDNVDESYAGERNNLLEADWTFQLCCCNRLQDRDETGIDCGGRHCPPCNRCDLTTLPSRFDWRDYFTLPPIRDQADCGSCWAHAAVGAIEGTYAINTGIIINLSEQYVICEVTGNCDGGCPHDVYRHARSTGIIEELCQPYLARNSPCSKCSDWRYKLWRIANYGRVSSSIEAIKRALICYGPLSVGSENWEHAIVIVGYDDSKSSWIIRNSWGTGWGEDLNGDGFPDDPGYGSVPYTGHSHSDIRDYVHYVIGVLAP